MWNCLSNAEWLEADGQGGFAMGTPSGVRTRRYHGLLISARTPPTGRVALVSGFDAWIETPSGRFALTTQCYRNELYHPDGESRIESFDWQPWPRWSLRLEDGSRIDHELFVPKGSSAVCLRWSCRGEWPGDSKLHVRPLLAARDFHCLQHENAEFCCDPEITSVAEVTALGRRDESRVAWRPYPGLPAIVSWSNGEYHHAPDWFRQFLYSHEAERGLDCLEDLASPGVLTWDLSRDDAVWLLTTDTDESAVRPTRDEPLAATVMAHRDREAARRARFPTSLHRAADNYVVKRGAGRSIIAGYPWFSDWGRDTFIALRGLCLATGRLDVARKILLSWAGTVSEGMLPNRFCDQGDQPEFNSVDASLWFVVVAHEYLRLLEAPPLAPPSEGGEMNRGEGGEGEERIREGIRMILNGYARGTRFGIRLDDDGLIAAGQAGVQLTWMDAKVGDWVVTPRIGKPVEVQALWLNALWLELQCARHRGDHATVERWQGVFKRGLKSFNERFWNANDHCLFDVIDMEHRQGEMDASFRPNQIFAVGGLPLTLLPPSRAKQVIDAVESRLWTPLGLRSLAPGSPGYSGHYGGSVWQRDAAYHQGTAWTWLLGSFVDAWVKTRDDPQTAKPNAYRRFVEPLLAHRYQAGLNHISEIADGDAPHAPRGGPFQAWSVGELLRLWHTVGPGTACSLTSNPSHSPCRTH